MENKYPYNVPISERLDGLIESFTKAIKFCRKNQISFDFHYSEVEENFEATLTGVGKGEYFEAKKCFYAKDAINRVIDLAEQYYKLKLIKMSNTAQKCIACGKTHFLVGICEHCGNRTENAIISNG